MKSTGPMWALLSLTLLFTPSAAEFNPGPQRFQQEVPTRYSETHGLPPGGVQCLDLGPDDSVRAFAQGQWWELRGGRWRENSGLEPGGPAEFTLADATGQAIRVPLRWSSVKQLIRAGQTNFIATPEDAFALVNGKLSSLGWSGRYGVRQIAVSPDGALYLASNAGLFQRREQGWEPVDILDEGGRAWAVNEVSGVAFDTHGQLWFASRAGVGCFGGGKAWKFYEGKDGLPWNDFTCMAAGPGGAVWFGTHRGAIRFDGREWHYRQGPRWLPHDDVTQIAVDAGGNAWLATAAGLSLIEFKHTTLAEKARFFEEEIDQYVRRTSFGYVAEAHLQRPGDKSSADPQDSDNDGLWTAMYGAGECFAYAATQDPQARARAKRAFEALRFLQVVTQGGPYSPPAGYIARTIRPVGWPDPNIGRLERDRAAQLGDSLWKVYEPRWPKSRDGQWFWKSDTSSDELDGHYFFYPLYYDFCSDTEHERARVREVVRGVTDHLLTHDLLLIDHDGRPTRWGIYGPQFLNKDPMWWPERGLKSLSVLSYLAVAAHITGDLKYSNAARELTTQYGYAHNAMYPKVQHGPGSGNQSDDEMAFMCYYTLLRYSTDEQLKAMIRYSFFRYWANEAQEMNPFFHFAYSAHNLAASATNAWGTVSLQPWGDWHRDAMSTLYSFPLDRLNWPHQNHHRLDLIPLPRVAARDLDSPDRARGYRVNGKVLPIENRHFNHWNTDPWQLDYGGSGNELGAGTVFLLPYYMGLYHGFIERPTR